MTDETKQYVYMVLMFLSGAMTLALKVLPVTPELQPWLIFGAGLIDIAMGIMFGRTALRMRSARLAAARQAQATKSVK